jgi:predicted nucleic acid-binding protein
MASEIFIDTSGFFATLDAHDQWHDKSRQLGNQATTRSTRYVTTDYVLCETLTLLRSRHLGRFAQPWLDNLLQTNKCRIIWMNPERFDQVRRFFVKHHDKEWSFTDCFSFCVMQERKMQQALASDEQFRQAGFEPLLVPESSAS